MTVPVDGLRERPATVGTVEGLQFEVDRLEVTVSVAQVAKLTLANRTYSLPENRQF